MLVISMTSFVDKSMVQIFYYKACTVKSPFYLKIRTHVPRININECTAQRHQRKTISSVVNSSVMLIRMPIGCGLPF